MSVRVIVLKLLSGNTFDFCFKHCHTTSSKGAAELVYFVCKSDFIS